MNKVFAVCLSAFFIATCSKSPAEMIWYGGSFDNAVASAGNRMVMVKFYTDS